MSIRLPSDSTGVQLSGYDGPSRLVRAMDLQVSMPLAIANLKLDSSSPLPIHQQISQGIRTAVWSHQLSPGALLPTIKDLAQHLGVARNTIALAYVHLVDEGLCVSNTRRGTRVASDNPSLCPEEDRLEPSGTSTAIFSAAFNARHALETHVNRVGGGIPFALFASDPVLYPRTKLGRRLADKFMRAPMAFLTRSETSCNVHFQKSIAAHLRNTRGISCDPDQVVAVSGLESALNLIARVLLDPGDCVAVEDPTMDVVHSAFSLARAQMYPLPGDSQGANPSRMKAPPARLFCVSPSVGFPFGAQMSESRRLELLAMARAQNAIVFECDSCGELRYAGGRIKSLYGLDTDERVIHYGGFFETLGGFVNVGYLVVPRSLRDVFHEFGCRAVTAPPAPLLDAIAEFIEENEYSKHTRAVRGVYARRLDLVKHVCKDALPGVVISEPLGGLHVVLQFDEDFDEHAVSEAATAENLPVRSLSQYYQQKDWRQGVVLGFGAVSNQSVPALVKRLSQLIDEAKRAAFAPVTRISG
jgi:GntR family transcriptional regulator / MocR family aminotransferase